MFFNLCSENCAFYDVEKYGSDRQATDKSIIRRMRFVCWITKTTGSHSEYVILIAFPRQWLRERLTILHLYVHCLSCYFIRRASVHVITNFHMILITNSYFPIEYYQLGVFNGDAVCFLRSRSCIFLVRANIILQTVKIDDHGVLCSYFPHVLITAYMLLVPTKLFSSI
jgi:hypothetical protein